MSARMLARLAQFVHYLVDRGSRVAPARSARRACAMAHLARASTSFEFVGLLKSVDKELVEFLATAGMHKPGVFARFFESAPGTSGARDKALEMARHAGAGDKNQSWATALEELHASAVASSSSIVRRQAAVDGL